MPRRPAGSEDESFVRTLLQQVVSDELGAGAWPEALRSLILETQYQARVRGIRSGRPAAEEEILLIGGDAAGWAVIERNPEEIRLVEIAVLPRHRGKGVATERIRELLIEADSEGKAVRLSVLHGNPARKLYERMGFRQSAQDDVRVYMERQSKG